MSADTPQKWAPTLHAESANEHKVKAERLLADTLKERP